MVYDSPLAPVIAPPLRRHWKARGALPAATTENVAEVPALTVCAEGGVVMEGGTITVSTAGSLVMLPTALVTGTRYAPASSVDALAIAYAALVAPAMAMPSWLHW